MHRRTASCVAIAGHRLRERKEGNAADAEAEGDVMMKKELQQSLSTSDQKVGINLQVSVRIDGKERERVFHK